MLALGGLAYAMLSSLVVPALPTMQRELIDRDGNHLVADRLPARGVGGNINHRAAWRYVRQGAPFTLDARCSRLRHSFGRLSSSLIQIIVAGFIEGLTVKWNLSAGFGIITTSFPREGCGRDWSTLSDPRAGGGVGIVLSGVVSEHLSYHWLFWIPWSRSWLLRSTWRLVPESPIRVPGRVNSGSLRH